MERVTEARELFSLRIYQLDEAEPHPKIDVEADLRSFDDAAHVIIGLEVAAAELLAGLARDPRVTLDDLRLIVESIAEAQAPTQRALDERRHAIAGWSN